jgi:type II secretory pathway pseudopilin PulG
MRVFKISGHVIDSKTKRGIKGLRVEAWDKDIFVSDLVGGTTTGDGGIFRIQFDESYFKDLFLDRRPDLFFKIFRGDKLIKDTKDSVLWNVDREDIEMTIEVEDSEGAITPGVVSSKEVETRCILQATYTPRKPKPEESLAKVSRGLEKGAFFSYLAPSHEELDELTNRYTEELKKGTADTTAKEKDLKTTEIISTAISKTGRINVLRSAKLFAKLEVDTFCRVAQDLIGLRQAALRNISEAHKTIVEEYTKTLSPEKAAPPTTGATVKDLMEWAIKNNLETKSAQKTLELGKSLSLNLQKIELNNFKALASRHINRLRNRVDECEESFAAEHIGYLHLERMSFTPAGIERGRLVHSVPLSPGEEVNIRQREWSRTSEEFERIVTDYLEEFSEEGVTEKTELTQSVDSQKQHSNAFNTAVSTSGEAWGFSITASVGYNASESASKSEQITRNHTRELTSKASSRSKQEHKISFRVASARETEDETVQRIKNPFPDRATRVDYYQLMRKWQVDLYRYGIRLTYDIAIPEPGSGILLKIREIQEIRAALELGFEHPNPTFDWPGFDMSSYTDINRLNYASKADAYGADVETPIDDFLYLNKVETKEWKEKESKKFEYHVIELNVDERYRVYVAFADIGFGEIWRKPSEATVHDRDENGNVRHCFGGSGKLSVLYRTQNLKSCFVELRFRCKLKDEVYMAWRLKAWNTIREAAQTQYFEKRQIMKERLARLQEELGVQDALSLRKKEREEVMKGVLRFLICPLYFEFFPENIFQSDDKDKDIEQVLYELETTGVVKNEGFRKDLLEHGETIKFLHHAIEWENMLYFLYPYFWTHPTRWEFKKYLDHPDPMHRAFLKAGSARVVLTIRSGFEDAFLAFINTGDMNDLPPSPYLEIGQEFRNYANTNYPGIPPANPVDNYRPLLYPKQEQAWEEIQFIMKLLEEYRDLPYPNQKKAWEDMKVIMNFLEKYRQEEGVYPPTLEALVQYFPNETIAVTDPWGNSYVYTYPGVHGRFDLVSYGADGQPGGEDENADITSWEEQYPETLDILEKHFPNETIPRKDPWGNDYVYNYPGTNGKYDLISYGKNGEPGGEGEDADITSWAEASLIGQWYEYTPTSALDIAFDETMPSA